MERSSKTSTLRRQRVDAFIDLQKRLLNAAAKQTDEVAESYREGKGWMVGASVAELARQAIEDFVETEKYSEADLLRSTQRPGTVSAWVDHTSAMRRANGRARESEALANISAGQVTDQGARLMYFM